MVIAGRSFYFDDASERDSCLGTTHGFRILTLNEFTDEQVAKYLARNHIAGQLPRWLPSRPLLLGYLAASGLLAKELTASALDQADRAWDDLLDKICKREADQQRGMYASEIREVLERLASRSRVGEEGIGPIEHELLWQVFEEVAGRKPDERDIVQLNRLPGLGIPPAVESESLSSSGRYFIDTDFADAARAGDVFRVVTEGRTFTQRVHLDAARWKHSLDELGVAVAAFKLSGLTKAKEIAHSAEMAADSQYFHLTWDLLRIAATNGQPVALSPISITGTDFGEVDIESLGTDLSHIEFRSCEIDRLIRGDLHAKHHPVFHGCVIETVIGPPLSPDEKERLFPQCELGTFQRLEMTTSSILELPAPAGTRVLLTILKKLYQQRGRGRKQSAFVRGLELDARKLVPEALRLVASFGLGTSVSGHSGPVWFPNRSARSRVGQILASPVDSTDPIVLESHRIA